MDNDYKNISMMENFISMLMARSGASKRFFVSRLPDEISKEWNDMMFADINPTFDRNAYATGSVSFFLYSRPEGGLSRKNVKAMLEMERKLMDAIKTSKDEHYVLRENWRDSDFNEKLGFFFNIINVSILVK